MAVEPFIVGNPVLVVVDIQNGDPPSSDGGQTIPHVEHEGSRVTKAAGLIENCREVKVPIVFIKEAHCQAIRYSWALVRTYHIDE